MLSLLPETTCGLPGAKTFKSSSRLRPKAATASDSTAKDAGATTSTGSSALFAAPEISIVCGSLAECASAKDVVVVVTWLHL